MQYSMPLDDFDHSRNLFLRVPFGEGLLINTFCTIMVRREFKQRLGLLFGHGENRQSIFKSVFCDNFW